ncbi:glutaredoxin family protein [Pseudoalteromonas sp. DL2-H2.2]|uniref:glutaredoxin family protein n=1 Tax=Pseudoalteromonas sp. DL2-H2.2 TaxID=2908889 RepID=UPI001F258A88|nr:glutaredoxin family protein [Pseudoalteromonas sp. DL2-H2.2]MCF2909406.1 glutaredoxin family protein [Pseudoalteromonas sp. DL2-H2.2]
MKQQVKQSAALAVMLLFGLCLGVALKYGYTKLTYHPHVITQDTSAHYEGTDKPVILYTTQWCQYCKQVKSYFKQHNINYLSRDIESDDQRIETLFDSLQRADIPQIIIGNKVITGTNLSVVEKTLREQSFL